MAPSMPPEDERWKFKSDDLKVQVKHYRDRCQKLEGHLHSAHNLLKEAAGTLTEDEIDQMDGLQRENAELREKLLARGSNGQLSGRNTPNLSHIGTVIKDRQTEIIGLKKELQRSDEMLEAAKTAHNVLVSELEKSKNDLSQARDSLQAANVEIADLKEARLASPPNTGSVSVPTVDHNKFIFKEQEDQIESDRRQISRLNKTIEEMRRKTAEDAVTIDSLNSQVKSLDLNVASLNAAVIKERNEYNRLSAKTQALQATLDVVDGNSQNSFNTSPALEELDPNMSRTVTTQIKPFVNAV